jgi:aminobenzoyl-glutamate utilization protein B
MSIGRDGMLVAARAIAITGADLFADPKVVADAKVEFKRQLHGRTYESLIPEHQKPPLNYRSN